MKERRKSHEALVCSHCGEKNRMLVLARASNTTEYTDHPGPPNDLRDPRVSQLRPGRVGSR